MDKDELLQWVLPPIDGELLEMAKNEPTRFMRDVISLPTKAVHPYITDITRIMACFKPDLVNPYEPEQNRFTPNWKAPDQFSRYIHIDLGRKKDAAALTMCHAPRFVLVEEEHQSVMRPVVRIDVAVRIVPKVFGEISPLVMFNHVIELRNRGFNIRLITLDQWQSNTILDMLRDEGFICGIMSIDRMANVIKIDRDSTHYIKQETTKQDYSHGAHLLKTYIMKGMLEMAFNPSFYEEVQYLEEDIIKHSVSVPTKLPDDLLQTVIGSIVNCWHNERYVDIFDEFKGTEETMKLVQQEAVFNSNKIGITDSYYKSNFDNTDRW